MNQVLMRSCVLLPRPFFDDSGRGLSRCKLQDQRRPSSRLCTLCAQKGFGSDTTRPKKKQGRVPDDSNWKPVAKMSVFQGKQIKAVEIKGKSILALYNVDGKIYCSQANSTAYEFPVTNGKILQRDGGPALQVALDGTIYDLTTGKVLEWCPRDNPFRAVLGTLKGNQTPKNLTVYPTRLDEDSGQIYVQFD